MTTTADAVIVGGGAAGLFCAALAGQRGRKVVVLERAEKTGKKILISGGGRCNFTNLHTRAEHFLSANSHFAKSALARFRPADFVHLVEKHKIPYHEKTLGQLFCDRSASDITWMLEKECSAGAVEVRTNCQIAEVRRTTGFMVETSHGAIEAPALVVASGGLSIPKMGATDLGYRIAKQFGHRIEPCYPALVPLTFDEDWRKQYCDLAGVAAPIVARHGKQSFAEAMLVTHRGLSGPAILQISSYWNGRGRGEISIALNEPLLPRRFAQRWRQVNGPAAEWGRWVVTPTGTEGYAKAEVTGGGVDTAELSSQTMESKRQSGLFFIGEVVDVTGHLGGFNFQWAWASGHACAQAL